MDAIEVLKGQHRQVESLFKQFERAKEDGARFELAQAICQMLSVHATIEEEILYPAVRSRSESNDREELKDLVLESLEEHLSVKRLVADIQAATAGDERLKAKVTVLKEQVSHHVEEEEREMFPDIKKEVSKEERQALGERLTQRAEELASAGAARAEGRVANGVGKRSQGARDHQEVVLPRASRAAGEEEPFDNARRTSHGGIFHRHPH